MNDGDGDTFIMDQPHKTYDVNDIDYVKNTEWTVKKRITPKKRKNSCFSRTLLSQVVLIKKIP